MALNYLPFLRRDQLIVPPRKADRVATGGFAVSDLARMASGGTQRAVVQELIVHPYGDDLFPYNTISTPIRMRVGVDGRNYMTEDLYDLSVYMDRGWALSSIWDWSCGKRMPYRLYPGQKMSVFMQTSVLQTAQNPGTPVAVMFNCMKVAWKSPIGTKEGEPMMLYANYVPPVTAAQNNDLVALESPRLICPKDSPVDIYSVTISECHGRECTGPTVWGRRVYILDGNERPFWDSNMYMHTIDIIASPITLGYGGCILDPDETLRVDLEEDDPAGGDNGIPMWITYRGVLEVDDGR